jgi:hypothetical protein
VFPLSLARYETLGCDKILCSVITDFAISRAIANCWLTVSGIAAAFSCRRNKGGSSRGHMRVSIWAQALERNLTAQPFAKAVRTAKGQQLCPSRHE